MMEALLRAEGVKKAFGKFMAVDGVDLTIPPGGITALIGPNGAGKTTLINLLTGRLIPDGGRITFHEQDITTLSPSERVRRGMGRSFQLVNIFPRLTVHENVVIPVLAHRRLTGDMFRSLDGLSDVHARANAILEQVGLLPRAHLWAGQLSHGDQRLLEIALALSTDPHLLILDEPTAGMNPRERVQVLEQIRRLAGERGATFLLVEHDMDVVFSLAQRIVVMHQGRVLADGMPEAIQQDSQVRNVYLGEAVLGEARTSTLAGPVSDVILDVRRLNTYYGLSHVLHDVSLFVRRGEVVAILGRNGVGKTTTLRSIMGLTPPKGGSIQLRGQEVAGRPAYAIASLGVSYVPDDTRIFPDLTTLENLRLPTQVLRRGNGRWNIEKVEAIFPPLRDLKHRKGRFLSGGEKKMLAIGRALMADPEVLLLDEPSEGLSPLIVRMLLDALERIRKGGVTILLADQNLKFAREVADRAYILEKGAIAYEGAMAELWRDEEVVKKYLAV
jgi:branched-chain amino acid transport system ATP-binding protein